MDVTAPLKFLIDLVAGLGRRILAFVRADHRAIEDRRFVSSQGMNRFYLTLAVAPARSRRRESDDQQVARAQAWAHELGAELLPSQPSAASSQETIFEQLNREDHRRERALRVTPTGLIELQVAFQQSTRRWVCRSVLMTLPG